MKNDNIYSLYGGQARSIGTSVSPLKDDGRAMDRDYRLSFKDKIKATADRLEFYAFRENDKALAYELCAIIAEVNIMRPGFSVKIGGEVLEAGLVQEVFSCLTHDHLESVIDAFDSCKYEIRNKKAYLRTALYNSVFELEAGNRNLFNYTED